MNAPLNVGEKIPIASRSLTYRALNMKHLARTCRNCKSENTRSHTKIQRLQCNSLRRHYMRRDWSWKESQLRAIETNRRRIAMQKQGQEQTNSHNSPANWMRAASHVAETVAVPQRSRSGRRLRNEHWRAIAETFANAIAIYTPSFDKLTGGQYPIPPLYMKPLSSMARLDFKSWKYGKHIVLVVGLLLQVVLSP